MSLFSRRSMTVVAGCALVLPLAAGTANAAFDLDGDKVSTIEETSASAEGSVSSTDATGSIDSSAGDGVVKAGENGARVKGCAAKSRPCAAVRGSGFPTVSKDQLAEIGGIDAEAVSEASKDGASVSGSATARGEDLDASADASTQGGSVEAETPFGDGSADATFDGSIAADGVIGTR